MSTKLSNYGDFDMVSKPFSHLISSYRILQIYYKSQLKQT